jgi:CBS domain-containing protein
VEAAAQLMEEQQIRRLLVVDAAGRLVGLLTKDNVTDLLLVRQAQR